MLRLLLLVAAFWLAGCGQEATTLDEYGTRVVTLQNGEKIRAEVMLREVDMLRGMMFRDKLEPDRGMLFIHGTEGQYSYWMYQVKVPLDIIWLDTGHKVVELVRGAAPCPGPKSKCPSYGGQRKALVVLELAAGSIDRHGIKVGQILEF